MIPRILITGSFGVGKSSLFDRIVHQKFEHKYLTTIGVRTAELDLSLENKPLRIHLWDIAGEVSQDKVPVSYFLEAAGALYVFDLTRPSTYKNIASDIDYLKQITGNEKPIWTVANKRDRLEDTEIKELRERLAPDFVTSALTGAQVDLLMQHIAKDLQ